jgi:DNA-binding XRE family transcriptional regulator
MRFGTQRAFRKMVRSFHLNPMLLARDARLDASRLRRWAKGKVDLTEPELVQLGAAVDSVLIVRARTPEISKPSPLVEPPSPEWGGAIRRQRQTWGIAQSELARRVGIAQGTVSLFENGYLVLNPENSKKLERVLAALVKQKRSRLNRGCAFTQRVKAGAGPTTTKERFSRGGTEESVQ